MSFQQQRIENLEIKINHLNSELSRLKGDVRPYEFRVIRAAEVYFQLEDLPQKSRRKRYVNARSVVINILRAEGYSLTEIGDALHRDHGTIIHSITHCEPQPAHIAAVRRLIG